MSTSPLPKNQYLEHLMLDVKNMRVKHVRKMFVLLRELGTDLHLEDMEHKTDWYEFDEFNKRLQLLVVQHGLTLGEFATGYVLNVQSRSRAPTSLADSLADEPVSKKRKVSSTTTSESKSKKTASKKK